MDADWGRGWASEKEKVEMNDEKGKKGEED